MRRTAWLLLLAAGCSGAGSPPAPAPAPAGPPDGPGVEYTGWPALTPEPVRVPEAMFAFCSIPPEQTRRGPHFVPAAKYYADPAGFPAVSSGRSPVPAGTTVVKEKFWNEKEPASAVAAMVKREAGYDPGGGDWEYVYAHRQEDGTWKGQRGKLDNCRACHAGAKETDYLFRVYGKK